jgi:hypothetical protein
MDYTITKTAPQLVGSDYDIEEIMLDDGTVWRALPDWGSYVRMYDHNGHEIMQQMPMNADGTPSVDEFCDVFAGECDPGFWEDGLQVWSAGLDAV